MITALEVIFWLSVAALAHTYIGYPLLMRFLARRKAPNTDLWPRNHPELPFVSVLMSVFNEEKVIAEKIANLRRLHYPADRLQILIGSDASNDATPDLVKKGAEGAPHFRFFDFEQRRGKPPVINELACEARASAPEWRPHIFLLTDASVMLEPDTLYRLVRHFSNPAIGVVDAHMRTAGVSDSGISSTENRYLNGEVLLKHHESLVWGQMIGPFGGCYALRAELFEPIPPRSLVDDFWLVFRVLERGFKAVNDLEAICYEGAVHRVKDEFRRKKRIAAGSFQNLSRFAKWVLPPATTLGFSFFSHKVLRWFGGFFILFSVLSAGILALHSPFYALIFLMMLVGLAAIPSLYALGFKKGPIRSLYYFLAMNAALCAGFFQWLNGIKGSTWQRTERN